MLGVHLEVNEKWKYSEGYIYPEDASALIPFEIFDGGFLIAPCP